MKINPGCANFKGLFLEDVVANYVFSLFGKSMQKLILTHWQLKGSWNTAMGTTTWMTSCLQHPQLMKLKKHGGS